MPPFAPFAPIQAALPARFGSMFEDLLDVAVHLAQEGGGDDVAVAFAGQDGGAEGKG